MLLVLQHGMERNSIAIAFLLDQDLPEGSLAMDEFLTQYRDYRPLAVSLRVPLRLTSWLRSTVSRDLGEVMLLVKRPLEEILQIINPNPHGEAQYTEVQAVRHLLDSFSISLGPAPSSLSEVSRWLSALARDLLNHLPLQELMVLLYAFIPQVSYSAATYLRRPARRSVVAPSYWVELHPEARGQYFLHEFTLRNFSPSEELGTWVPYSTPDTTPYSLEDWQQHTMPMELRWALTGGMLLFS